MVCLSLKTARHEALLTTLVPSWCFLCLSSQHADRKMCPFSAIIPFLAISPIWGQNSPFDPTPLLGVCVDHLLC